MTPRHASRGGPSPRHGSGGAQHGAGQHGAGQYGAGQYGAGQYGPAQYGAGQHPAAAARPTPGPGRHAGPSRPGRPAPPGRPRVAADPVQVLLERHQDLYADAVDPLDIAVVLERSGIGPETAGRFRHADVFSLAEELHARVPRRAAAPPPVEGAWRRRARPAFAAGAALTAVALLLWCLRTLGFPAPLGAQAVAFAAAAAPTLGRGLRLPERALLAFGVGGLLALAQRAGPPQLALAAGAGLADWTARWYRHLGWGHVRSRSSREFRSRMRPVLPTVVLACTAGLAGLTAAALALPTGGAEPGWGGHGGVWTAQLGAGGVLLAALLLRHAERTPSALTVLAAACGCVALAGAVPPHPTLTAWACALSAALLLPYGWVCLLSPAAHRPPSEQPGPTPHEPGHHDHHHREHGRHAAANHQAANDQAVHHEAADHGATEQGATDHGAPRHASPPDAPPRHEP